MIITKEHQEAMLAKYAKENPTHPEQWEGFIDGMYAMFELIKNHYHPLLNKGEQAAVMQRCEQLFAFLEYCDSAGWIKNVDKKRIIEDYEKANNCC